jgi:hypothetical protein
MSTQQANVQDKDIVYCPKCNCNLFTPCFVYAYVPSNIPVIDQPKVLSQCLAAFKCADCGQVIPQSQFSEFTQEKLALSAKEQKTDGSEEKFEQDAEPQY